MPRRARSSVSRSAPIKRSRTSSPTRTPTSSSRARSPTGPRGASRRTTSRRWSRLPQRSRSRPRRRSPHASGRSRCTAASASRGSIPSIASTSARSGSRGSARVPGSCGSKSPTQCSASPFPCSARGGGSVDGLMMDFPLTLPHILRRSETFFGNGEIVTRLPDKSFHRTNYRETMARARRLAAALQKLGLERGTRVATLCWNHHQHHEAYFGIPCGGFVLHTLNLRLHPNDLAYIANHADDRVVIVDRSLVPLLEQFRDRTAIEHVFVVEDTYEELLATAPPDEWRDPELDENEAAAMCYTSGTTGQPKGVVYSHRSTVLHALGVGVNDPFGLGTSVNDAILPVVPMFHANAWGYPYLATLIGAKLVYPGPHLDPQSLLEDFVQEKVTWSAGVPTIWMGILQLLDANP